MDHSIYGYLTRRSTDELHFSFYFYLQQDDFRFYEHICVMCQEILKTRLSPADPLLSEYGIALEKRRKDFYQDT